MTAAPNWLTMWTRFRPHAEALYDVGLGRRFTYAELALAARTAARSLSGTISPGDRVAVLAQNRAETLILLFACAELGAVLVPLNWRLSAPEIAWQLGDCTPAVVFVESSFADRLEGHPDVRPIEAVLSGSDSAEAVAPLPAGALPGSSLEDPWMILYTSGSSGRPKGALLTHQQVLVNAATTVLACELDAGCSTFTFTPLFHTGGMNCLTTPMFYRGGRVVLTNRFDPGEALRLIAGERVTHLMGVPTIYQMLAEHADFEHTDLSAVRDALCGGAPLSLPLLTRYQARDIPLRQGFGLTEVGPNCFSTPPAEATRKLGSVGLPIHHIEAKLVRADGSTCGVDEPGELWLRGPLVCGGYWNNPKATAESITEGWFHTGDVLSCDAEGFYYVRGRIKEMYISGGENVYPAEVEAVILMCPGVGQAAVVGVPDPRWGESGVAFVEPSPGATLDPSGIRAFLDGKLARYKLPREIRVVEALPRTGSGKIDKPALRAGR